MTNHKHGTLYIGSTTTLAQRVWQHKNKVVPGFTATHALRQLVWYEVHPTIDSAAMRERSIKRWLRSWKIQLIEQKNPEWKDLYPEL